MSSGAALHRHTSRQDYATPREFVNTVAAAFGPIAFDLAATAQNTVARRCFTIEQDSLAQDWTKLRGNLWCNPPYADIAPWAAKCAASSAPGRRIFFLAPASVGSNWFAESVHGKALVLALRPRLSFDGRHPYPKDLLLSIFGAAEVGFDCWRWR